MHLLLAMFQATMPPPPEPHTPWFAYVAWIVGPILVLASIGFWLYLLRQAKKRVDRHLDQQERIADALEKKAKGP